MKNSLKKNTIFYGISKYMNVFVTLLTTSILARILTPAEFGVVSVVTVFTAFFTILSDLGLGSAVIQNKELTQKETDDIFGFSFYIAIGLGVIFAALGWPISLFFEEPIYLKICILLSLSVFFNAANVIPNAILMKEKNFRSVGKRMIITSLASGLVAIILALLGFSYYAIIVQSIFQALFIFVWNLRKSKLKLKLTFSVLSIHKVKQYSTYQFLYSIINYFARNIDNLLIGKTMGNVNLAYYDKGYRLMMYPIQNLTYVINPVVHPILSEHQKDKEYIFSAYIKITRILSLIGLIVSAICFWCSEEIVLIFFGSQWHESVPIFRILSISVWPQLISSSAGSIYQSIGNTKLMFRSGIIHFSTTIILIVIGIIVGDLNIIALLVSTSLYFRFFIDYYFLIVYGFKFRFIRFLKEFRWDLLNAGILIVTILLLKDFHVDSILLGLTAKCSILCGIYVLVLLISGDFKRIIALLGRKQNEKEDNV